MFARCLLDVCSIFARSCKRGIRQLATLNETHRRRKHPKVGGPDLTNECRYLGEGKFSVFSFLGVIWILRMKKTDNIL